MTEYNGAIPAGGAMAVSPPGGNGSRRRLKYQNNGVSLMRFSATTGVPASLTVGLAVPGGSNQVYEWPSHIAAAIIGARGALTSPDNGVPTGQITVWGQNPGDTWYVEEE
jgi:hypothetical protein